MDNREIIALGLLAAMIVILAWVAYRKISAKRAFKHRQSGRGKSIDK